MPKIISTPYSLNVTGQDLNSGFAYYQTPGVGEDQTQREALSWHKFEHGELRGLTPSQIGQRLWTTYHHLNASLSSSGRPVGGSTASTTVIKGNHLITATLANAHAFAVTYNAAGEVIGVQRLNQGTKGPRALGDFAAKGVSANAEINITTIPPGAAHVQIINTSDDFAGGQSIHQSKEEHETHLKTILQAMNGGKPGLLSPSEITENLVTAGIKNKSKGNISITVQTARKPGLEPFMGMVGVFGGYRRNVASTYAAKSIGATLTGQLLLTEEKYAAQTHSAAQKAKDYERDNKAVSSVPSKPLSEMLEAKVKDFLEKLALFIDDNTERLPDKHTKENILPQKNLLDAVIVLEDAIKEATEEFKAKKIDLDVFKERCEIAIDTCKTQFQTCRGGGVWETYFAPLVRMFLSCINESFAEEHQFDMEVKESVNKCTLFKKQLEMMHPDTEEEADRLTPKSNKT